MAAKTFDALVIGAGQAGPPLAARLAGAGWKLALVEKGAFGGTCVNDGCTPTKAMIASARAAWMVGRAGEYGVVVDGGPRVDMAAVKARKDAIVAKSREGVEKWMAGLDGIEVYRGHARFTGPRTVEVNSERLTAEHVFLDVGGRPRVPAIPGLDTVPFLTNVAMMSLDFVPEHLIVVGGSYVGLEFAQMMRRLGSGVTVVEMGPRVVVREDEDVSEAIAEMLRGEGIRLRVAAECVDARTETDGISIGVHCKTGEPRERGSHLLLAVGRVPNTDDLGLDAAGIETDERGHVVVDEELRTSNPCVWALGDCNGKGAFTHTAYNDYEIVADNLLSGTRRRHTDRVPVYALYTDPPLGRVGMNEAQIRSAGLHAMTGTMPMARVSRAVEKGETQGLLRIHVERESRRILGASLLGTGADEVVHSLIDAVYMKIPCTEFQRHVRIHPNVSELLPTVLENLKPV